MKKYYSLTLLIATLFLTSGLMAQTSLTVKVQKDGKVVKDTVYQFDDEKEAEHVLKMVELMTGEGLEGIHEEHYVFNTGGKHKGAAVFISEDGEKTVIKKFEGDSTHWHGDDGEMSHKVIVMKDGDELEYEIITEAEGEEGKEIKVWVVEEDGNVKVTTSDDGSFTIEEGDGQHVKVKKVIKEGAEGEEVEVIIVKTKAECDHEGEKDSEPVKKKEKQ